MCQLENNLAGCELASISARNIILLARKFIEWINTSWLPAYRLEAMSAIMQKQIPVQWF
jgi:hypothetical protein